MVSKLKKKKKDIAKEAYKVFSDASSFMINDNLSKVDFGELVMGLYLPTKDEDIQKLLKSLEKYILHAKLHPEEAGAGLHRFCMSVSEDIRGRNLYRKFYKMAYLVYVSLDAKQVNQEVINAYFNLTIQLHTYLSKSPKILPYGISKNGNLLVRNEIINNLVDINVELSHVLKTTFSVPAIIKIYSKYGYKGVKTYLDVQQMTMYDQVISNMLFHMAYFIDEDNESIVAPPYANPNNMPSFHEYLDNVDHVDKLKNRIRQREILLPSEGIFAKPKKMTSIKEVYLEEVIRDDNIILLYRIKLEDGYLSGFYDTRNEFFYSPWSDSNAHLTMKSNLQNLILQMYLYLTCTLSETEKSELYGLDNIFMEFEVDYSIKVVNPTSKYQPCLRRYDRSQYLAELINIKPFLRHLPIGAEASASANALARKLGIDLPKGMTLVSGFNRKSWTKDKKEAN